MILARQKCKACRADSPSVVGTERAEMLERIPLWSVEEISGVAQLCRTFDFANFIQALAFTNEVGELAEAEDHHPSITTEWGKVKVSWWTHTINGLHMNDFILAARCDQAYRAA